MNFHVVPAASSTLSHPDEIGKGRLWEESALALALVLAAFALALASVLKTTGGSFGYMLDDPYIHLSMAEQILRGEYGINPGEPASASSSILFPYLLAGLMTLGAGSSAPLLVNLGSLGAMVFVVAAILREVAGAPSRERIVQRALIVAALCLSLNVIALTFSGMEHGLHMTLTAAGLLGLLMLQRRDRPPLWWLAVLVVTPLIRYEGVGLLLAGALALALNRKPGAALLVTACSFLCLGAFSLYLRRLGLPLLPSSVLVKGEETLHPGAYGLAASLVHNLFYNLTFRDGLILLAFIGLFGWQLARAGKRPGGWSEHGFQIALFGITVTAGHLALGRFHAFNRYSTYALALGLLCTIVLQAREARFVLLRGRAGATVAVLLGLCLLFPAHIAQSMVVGISAANIHLQQYQVHRFATEFWRAPIAVNDIGWPSYRNDGYVLDLWGLGSEPARQMRRLSAPVEGLAALAEQKDVKVAAIYEYWFLTKPAAWVAVARLKLDIERVTADGDTVTFFATRPDHVPLLREKLEAFGRTLPAGASLHFD